MHVLPASTQKTHSSRTASTARVAILGSVAGVAVAVAVALGLGSFPAAASAVSAAGSTALHPADVGWNGNPS
jgi:ABC-type nitrate/sulfonate/bicarbonate transport system permease component